MQKKFQMVPLHFQILTSILRMTKPILGMFELNVFLMVITTLQRYSSILEILKIFYNFESVICSRLPRAWTVLKCRLLPPAAWIELKHETFS